jgi:hypothetical protein
VPNHRRPVDNGMISSVGGLTKKATRQMLESPNDTPVAPHWGAAAALYTMSFVTDHTRDG